MTSILLFICIHLSLITYATFPFVLMAFRTLYAKYDMIARNNYESDNLYMVMFLPLNIGLLIYYRNRKRKVQYTVNEEARKTRSAIVIWFKRFMIFYGVSLLIMTLVSGYLVYTS